MTKYEGTGKMCSLQRGFVMSGSFSINFTIGGLKKIVRYTGFFVKGGVPPLYLGSTV